MGGSFVCAVNENNEMGFVMVPMKNRGGALCLGKRS